MSVIESFSNSVDSLKKMAEMLYEKEEKIENKECFYRNSFLGLVAHCLRCHPFNLHPIFSFEKMGTFKTLEFNLIFFSGWQPEKKLGFIR